MNEAQGELYRQAMEAHATLAKSLQMLRGAMGNRPVAQRALSIAITEAETSFLWLRAVHERAELEAAQEFRGPLPPLGP